MQTFLEKTREKVAAEEVLGEASVHTLAGTSTRRRQPAGAVYKNVDRSRVREHRVREFADLGAGAQVGPHEVSGCAHTADRLGCGGAARLVVADYQYLASATRQLQRGEVAHPPGTPGEHHLLAPHARFHSDLQARFPFAISSLVAVESERWLRIENTERALRLSRGRVADCVPTPFETASWSSEPPTRCSPPKAWPSRSTRSRVGLGLAREPCTDTSPPRRRCSCRSPGTRATPRSRRRAGYFRSATRQLPCSTI